MKRNILGSKVIRKRKKKLGAEKWFECGGDVWRHISEYIEMISDFVSIYNVCKWIYNELNTQFIQDLPKTFEKRCLHRMKLWNLEIRRIPKFSGFVTVFVHGMQSYGVDEVPQVGSCTISQRFEKLCLHCVHYETIPYEISKCSYTFQYPMPNLYVLKINNADSQWASNFELCLTPKNLKVHINRTTQLYDHDGGGFTWGGNRIDTSERYTYYAKLKNRDVKHLKNPKWTRYDFVYNGQECHIINEINQSRNNSATYFESVHINHSTKEEFEKINF